MMGGKPLGAKDKPLGETAQKQIIGTRNLQQAIADYQDELKDWSNTKMLSPDARKLMGNAYNNMMLQGKEAYNLGVLNGPDLGILQAVVADPTSPSSAMLSNGALSKQAAELSRIAGNIEKVSMDAHGKAYTPFKPVPRRPNGPQPGDIKDGYRFKGGEPGDQANWERM
jgi:hypothetical protein